MSSSQNSIPSFWIVDFGVRIKAAPLEQYSLIESYDEIPFNIPESTELIILLEQEYFTEFKTLTRENCKLILVCDPEKSPPIPLFKQATFCIPQKDDNSVLEFLAPYLFQLNTPHENKVRQLHLVCDELGNILYYDKSIYKFFNLESTQEIRNFKDIPVKFRYGELKTFEPIEELLKVDKIDTWLNFRSTKTIDVFRVYVNKEEEKLGDQTFKSFSFNLWPKKSQLEESYAANVDSFTRLLEESFDAILISDTSRIIKYASPGITRLTGYSQEELIGLDTADFTLAEDAIKTHPIISQVRNSQKERVNVQHRIRHKNGNYVWIDVLVTDRRDTPGIMGIVSSIRDINAEKRSRLALEEWKRRFELASRATQDVIWDLDLSSNKITWGENVEDIFGWTADELSTLDKWLDKVHEQDKSTLDQSFDGVLNGSENLWSAQFGFLFKNGKLASIQDRGYAIRDDEGKAIRLIGAMHDNTDAVNFERQLIKGEEKFRKLFEESLIGVSLVELNNFPCLDCNQALLNILGYRREEFLKMSLLELIPEQEKNFFHEEMSKLKNSERAISFQLGFIRKDLSVIKVALSAFTIEGGENGPCAWMHILDLSPIIESSAALKAAENRFKSYIEKSSDIFATLNDSSIYEYVSPNITKLLGYQPSEVIGLHNFDLIHPDDHERILKAYTKADEEIGKVTRSTFRALHKDGSTLWVEASGKIENTEQGFKAFINIRDIEKEHQNEEELRRLSLVANKTENAVIITDPQMKAVWANKSFEKLSGYSMEDTISELITRKLFSPKTAKNLEAHIEKGEVFKTERKAITKSGEKLWLELSVTPAYDEDKLLKNYIFVAVDVSKKMANKKQLEANVNLLNEQNEKLRSLASISSQSLLTNNKSIEEGSEELEPMGHTLVQEELMAVLMETTEKLSASISSFESILNFDSTPLAMQDKLRVKDVVDKAQRLLIKKNIGQSASIEFIGETSFSVKYFPPYLLDIFHSIFAQLQAINKKKDLNILVDTRKEKAFKVVELQVPIKLDALNGALPKNTSELSLSFPENIERISKQLDKYGSKLSLNSLNKFEVVLCLFFKDSD